MRRILPLIPVLVLAAAGAPVEAEEGPSPKAVHSAIRRGAEWLRGRVAEGLEGRTWHDPLELVVLTLHHAGANLEDEAYAQSLDRLQSVPLQFTYRVSVLAMALAEINPGRYRDRLAHSAQWLVDTQLAGGEWGYPGSIQGRGRQPYPATVAPPAWPEGEEAPPDGARPPVVRRAVVPTFEGEKGDFSNTQFAILGLRACRDAGIDIPKATWEAALDFLVKTQRSDGGWGYHYAGQPDDASYASLTCAGTCSAAICLHALGKRPDQHAAIRKAKAWLGKNLDIRKNAGQDRSAILGPSTWQYYHLYSLERVGRVLGWKEVGDTAWYPAGATWILGQQRGDGSWEDPAGTEFGGRPGYLTVADTCFAILFLAQATPPLTGG